MAVEAGAGGRLLDEGHVRVPVRLARAERADGSAIHLDIGDDRHFRGHIRERPEARGHIAVGRCLQGAEYLCEGDQLLIRQACLAPEEQYQMLLPRLPQRLGLLRRHRLAGVDAAYFRAQRKARRDNFYPHCLGAGGHCISSFM